MGWRVLPHRAPHSHLPASQSHLRPEGAGDTPGLCELGLHAELGGGGPCSKGLQRVLPNPQSSGSGFKETLLPLTC